MSGPNAWSPVPLPSSRSLPKLTITWAHIPAAEQRKCGKCDGRATEIYFYSDHGGPIRRCDQHGGEDLRDSMRARGHSVEALGDS